MDIPDYPANLSGKASTRKLKKIPAAQRKEIARKAAATGARRIGPPSDGRATGVRFTRWVRLDGR